MSYDQECFEGHSAEQPPRLTVLIITVLGAIGTGVWQAFQYIKDHWR